MTDRPTQIERAFALATSGTVNSTKEIKEKLRAEGYSENGQVHGRTMMMQLTKLIAEAKAKPNADPANSQIRKTSSGSDAPEQR